MGRRHSIEMLFLTSLPGELQISLSDAQRVAEIMRDNVGKLLQALILALQPSTVLFPFAYVS
ncbi:hypothetical protein JCM17092_33960 [Haloplanus litoreus]